MGGRSNDEVEITMKRSEGGWLQVKKLRSAPELVVAQTQMKNMEAGKEKKRKIAGWSTKMLEEEANMQEYGTRGHEAVEKQQQRRTL